MIRVDNLFGADESSASCSVSWLSRVLPRGARYSGRMHEQPDAAWPRRRLDVVVHHDGYLDLPMRGKRGRNDGLLRLALAERPDDAYLHYQLGKDLELRSLYSEALPYYQRAHAAAEHSVPWRHDLLLRMLFTLKKLARFERRCCLHRPNTISTPIPPTIASRSATCCSTGLRMIRRVAPNWCR